MHLIHNVIMISCQLRDPGDFGGDPTWKLSFAATLSTQDHLLEPTVDHSVPFCPVRRTAIGLSKTFSDMLTLTITSPIPWLQFRNDVAAVVHEIYSQSSIEDLCFVYAIDFVGATRISERNVRV